MLFQKMNLSKYVFFIILFHLSFYLLCYSYADMRKEEASVSIPFDRPAEMSTQLILDKYLDLLFPEITKPRLLTLNDIKDPRVKGLFERYGFSSLLKDDFNKDGYEDIAIAGISSDPGEAKKGIFIGLENFIGIEIFIGIISIREKTLTREYFLEFRVDGLSLSKEVGSPPNFDRIFLEITPGSSHCGVLYWDGNKYNIVKCGDYEDNVIPNNFE